MKQTRLLLVFVFGLFISLHAHAASITGLARITDGDTIEILGMAIRLEGIDAPENGQTCKRPGGGQYDCGKDATDYLRGLMGQEVSCKGSERGKYGRPLACPSSLFVRQQNQIVKLDTNLEEVPGGGLEFTG